MAAAEALSQRYLLKDPQLVYELLPQIERALEDTVGMNVIDAVRYLDEGENLSFKVIADQGKVMVRIFRFPTWPDKELLRFVDKTAKAKHFPCIQRLYLDDTDTYFPYGFSVREWRDGVMLQQLYDLDLWSRYQMMEVIGKLLRKVHFPQERFGRPPFTKDRPGYASFLQFQLEELQSFRLVEAMENDIIEKALVEEATHLVQALIQSTPGEITPVFSHGDPQPSNVVLTDTGSVLIDWEQACSSSWALDFAILTFWWEHTSRRELFDAYQVTKEQEKQFDYLELVHHIVYSLRLLPYLASVNERENYGVHCERLKQNMERARHLLQNRM